MPAEAQMWSACSALVVLLQGAKGYDLSQPAEEFRRIFKEIAAFQDFHVAKMTAAGAKGGYPVACTGRGCSWCCYDVSMVSLLESYILLDALAALPDEKRCAVKSRLAMWMKVHVEQDALLPIFGPDVDFDPDPHVRKMIGVSIWHGTPCAFLDPEDKACLVYAVRPFSCRGHYILSRGPGNDRVYTQEDCLRKVRVQDIGLPTWDPLALNLAVREKMGEADLPPFDQSSELSIQMDRFLLLQHDAEYGAAYYSAIGCGG